jgi:aryl-alcohol dehydrogenase-like predicted oxidoreductase
VQTGTIGSEKFSVIGLGAYELGQDQGWSGAREVLTAAIESGTDWLDTSEAYYDEFNERTVGAAMRDVGVPIKVSSKVAPDASGFRADQVRKACTGSLERLGIDRLDMYLLHYPDETGVPLEETWTAVRQLVDDGLVVLAGLSNFDQAQIELCQTVGPVDVVQEGLSPIDHLDTLELARWCSRQGIGVVTYEPLGSGMLAGAIQSPEDFVRVVDDYEEWGFWKRLFAPGRFERSEVVREGMQAIAERIGCSLPQLAIAWNIQQEGVSATLAGTSNPVHARTNAEAADVVLTRDQIDEIDALIPLGPTFA